MNARERITLVLCKSGKFETGEGTCAMRCMENLGDVRKRGCPNAGIVHGVLADKILSALNEEAK